MAVFNFIVHSINFRIAKSFSYKGIVVDLGCGNQPYKEIVCKTADKYFGFDWSQSDHIDSIKPGVFCNLLNNLPVRNNIADMAVAFQVLEHLPEPQLFLKEVFRILKPGGECILTVPFAWHLHEVPNNYYRYT